VPIQGLPIESQNFFQGLLHIFFHELHLAQVFQGRHDTAIKKTRFQTGNSWNRGLNIHLPPTWLLPPCF